MFETPSTLERKALESLMGGSASKQSLDMPFPVNPKENGRLDLLSLVVARIMNTPDIYDINNLARPGVCGDYAVILKKDIQKKFLPFITDLSGNLQEIVYQNPTKMIKSEQERKEVCSQITDTALRVASIVLASLASIQVATESRESVIGQVQPKPQGHPARTPDNRYPDNRYLGYYPPQRGGGLQDIRNWLVINGYITQSDADKTIGNQNLPINLTKYGSGQETYSISFLRTEANITHANLTARSPSGAPNQMPSGSLKLQFLNPFTVPGTSEKMLPIRILDNTGIPWMVGVLYNNVYKSLGPPGVASPFDIWHALFRKSQGWEGRLVDNDINVLQASNIIFEQARKSGSPDAIIKQLTPFLSQNIPGFTIIAPVNQYNPYAVNPYAPNPNPYAANPNPYAANPYAVNPYAVNPNPYAANPYAAQPYNPYAGGVKLPSALRLNEQVGIQYTIPDQQATRTILTTLNSFKDLYIKKSCPATVRANTLSVHVNDNRTIRTGVCSDPYWKETNLSKIYPYATLQFLCIKEWNKIGAAGMFTDDWATFITGLKTIYGDKISGSDTLDKISFKNVAPSHLCGDMSQNVHFNEVQVGLTKIHEAYDSHIKIMWKLLGDLVEVIEDPDTKTEMVRMVKAATASGMSSKKYVDSVADRARKQIISHYLTIEKIYYETAKSLRPTS